MRVLREAVCQQRIPRQARTKVPQATTKDITRSRNDQQHRKRVCLESPDVRDDSPSHINPPEDPPPVRSVCSGRVIRLPRYLEDYVPHGDMSLAHVPPRVPTPTELEDR